MSYTNRDHVRANPMVIIIVNYSVLSLLKFIIILL